MYPKCIVVGIRYLIELFVLLSVVGKKGKVGALGKAPAAKHQGAGASPSWFVVSCAPLSEGLHHLVAAERLSLVGSE